MVLEADPEGPCFTVLARGSLAFIDFYAIQNEGIKIMEEGQLIRGPRFSREDEVNIKIGRGQVKAAVRVSNIRYNEQEGDLGVPFVTGRQ